MSIVLLFTLIVASIFTSSHAFANTTHHLTFGSFSVRAPSHLLSQSDVKLIILARVVMTALKSSIAAATVDDLVIHLHNDSRTTNDDWIDQVVDFSIYSLDTETSDSADLCLSLQDQMRHCIEDGVVNQLLSRATELQDYFVPTSSLTIANACDMIPHHQPEQDWESIVVEDNSVLKLVLLGDWGKGGLQGDITSVASSGTNSANSKVSYTYQAAIARSMARYIKLSNNTVAAVLALGDNFYTSGVTSASDAQWSSSWREVYSDCLQLPWYAVLGNHDYGYGQTGVAAQIDRDLRHDNDDIWHMPATNYTRYFALPNDAGLVQLVFIDTATLAPSENKCCNSKGGISSSLQAERISNQLSHIEQMLKEGRLRKPDWVLVVGHYPIFSAGDHADTAELKDKLLGLLTSYGVAAYVSGHDHISQHLKFKDMHFIGAGAGALTDKLGSVTSTADLLWAGTGFSAFGTLEITQRTISLSFIDIYGDTVYSAKIVKTQKTDSARHSSSSMAMAEALQEFADVAVKPWSKAMLIVGLVAVACAVAARKLPVAVARAPLPVSDEEDVAVGLSSAVTPTRSSLHNAGGRYHIANSV